MRDEARFKNQRQEILTRLRRGPATNAELSEIALRFGARLYDLRRDGYAIECRNLGGGLAEYVLR